MNELAEKVGKWVSEQGYPVEMFVAKLFRKAGFRTTQSEYYTDPESGDDREIDVVASTQKQIGEILVRISVCIECKSAKKHPWVLFTSKDTRLAKPAAVIQRPTSKLGKVFLHQVAHDSDVHNIAMFSLGKRNGYSLTEAFTSGKDNAYSSCISVAKCAKALVKEADQASRSQGPICEIVIPLVLIDGKLFECHQDKVHLEVKEIQRSQLIWRNQISNIGHSIINVSTKDVLPSFIDDVQELSACVFSQKNIFQLMQRNDLSEYPNRWKRNR